MAWLYVPSAFVPESAGSTSESNWPAPRQELSVTWKGKPLPQESWPSVCRREPWTRLLSGTTLEPSTATHGVVQWIWSLPDSHVNRYPWRENNSGPEMIVGSGPKSSGWSARFDPVTSSWRTYEGFSPTGSGKSSRAWPTQGSMRNGECFPQPTWEQRTEESASSSWPTPTVRDWKDGRCVDAKVPTNSLLGRTSVRWAAERGLPPQRERESGRRLRSTYGLLNSRFVEWLMGFPVNYTAW